MLMQPTQKAARLISDVVVHPSRIVEKNNKVRSWEIENATERN